MIKLYNTLTRKKEEFKPIAPSTPVGLYTCGPTVYNYAHLGNLRTYIFEDILKRVLMYNGYQVKHVMNITDVGHLTGDRDMGEDKLEKEAEKENKTAWEVADFYTMAFKRDMKELNLIEPDIWCKATEHIQEQIDLIKILEAKGYTYKTSDGIYYDTSKFKNYNQLSHQKLSELKEGARVEANPEKKNPTDFALWKFSPKGVQRDMEWDSPWGMGFPGWHIECSAMSLKYLGDHFDIHCGGIDHINVHHTNEIAQTEAATGKSQWVNYWVHGAFLNIAGGKKMAKSEGNFLTLENALIKKGIDPLVYRYAALTVHYRKPMEYSDEAIESAKNGLEHLRNQILELKDSADGFGSLTMTAEYKDKFLAAIDDDLNTPKALAVVAALLKDKKIKAADKLATIIDFDRVLGLNLGKAKAGQAEIPDEILVLVKQREEARKNKDWKKSDELRDLIKSKGFEIEDTASGSVVKLGN